jgi:hypothetical protein
MTRAEIEALLGPEQTKRALDALSNPQRDTGVSIDFSHADGVIDSISYSAYFKFPRDVPVCGLRIGMTVDEMRLALPELRLADGHTGEPNQYGFVRYQAQPASLNVAIAVSMKDGEVFAISLDRTDMDEVRAQRERRKADLAAEQKRANERANQWKSEQDPNEMLLAWAEHCSPWTDSSQQKFVAFARWLIAMSDPDAWHIVATNWNWDYGRAPLLWIIRQNNCDIATALDVFFLADPSYYFQYGSDRSSVPADWRLEMYDFLAEIRLRLAQGFYRRSEIAFDGGQHMSYINRGLQTAEEKALAQSFYPPAASWKIPGRDLTNSDDDVARKCHGMLASVR